MALRIVDSVKQLLHDTSVAIIDKKIVPQMSDLTTSAVKSGFEIVDSALGIVRDLTKEETPESQP